MTSLLHGIRHTLSTYSSKFHLHPIDEIRARTRSCANVLALMRKENSSQEISHLQNNCNALLKRADSGIPSAMHPFIESIDGNASLREARYVILKMTNHDDEIQNEIAACFPYLCLEEGMVVLREGWACMKPVDRSCAWTKKCKVAGVQELGWDDMELHRFCTQFSQKLKTEVTIKKVCECLGKEVELIKHLPARKVRKSVEAIEKKLEPLSTTTASLTASMERDRPIYQWAIVDGRNLSLKRALSSCKGRKVIAAGGAAHFTKEIMDTVCTEKFIVITFKDRLS